MGVPLYRWMVYNGKSQTKMDDLEVPPILGNLQIAIFVPLPRDTSPLGLPDKAYFTMVKSHGKSRFSPRFIPLIIPFISHIFPYFPIFFHGVPCFSMFFPCFSIAFSIHHHPKALGIPHHFVREGPQGAPRQCQGVFEAIVFHLGADHVMDINLSFIEKVYMSYPYIYIYIFNIYIYIYLYIYIYDSIYIYNIHISIHVSIYLYIYIYNYILCCLLDCVTIVIQKHLLIQNFPDASEVHRWSFPEGSPWFFTGYVDSETTGTDEDEKIWKNDEKWWNMMKMCKGWGFFDGWNMVKLVSSPRSSRTKYLRYP